MHKAVTAALAAGVLTMTFASGIAAARSDASINKEIETYIIAHPLDFVGIDSLVFRYTGEHIVIGTVGVDGPMTAIEAQALRAETLASGQVGILSGIPAFTVVVTSVALSGGGRAIWGTWDFPDSWAGQGAPADIAATSVSMNTCVQMSNIAVWTYSTVSPPGSTNLGTLRSVQPALGVVWNINDYVSGFQDMADRGTTRVEVRRGSGCPTTVQVGAAFDYEANRGGSILGVSLSFGFFSVTYTGYDLQPLHLGTNPIYFNI